jgi:ribonuclease R
VGRRGRGGSEEFEGPVQRTASGAGFFELPFRGEPGPSAELFITASDMRGALNGDTICVRMTSRRRGGGGRCGEVVAVLERSTTRFVGRYFEQDGCGRVLVDRRLFANGIEVGDPGVHGACPGDQVVLEMLQFPEWDQVGEGVVVEVLGQRDRPGVDLQTVIHEFGLPGEFSEEVLEAARAAADGFDDAELGDRQDFTSMTVITIDPSDARDFDDALSLEVLPGGGWRLGVHIADVSHFIPPRGALDREAKLRGTSVYLPGTVIPMLPELLSNGLASLQQDRLRYVLSALIEYTDDGVVRDVRFARAAIRVTRRFSYEEVTELLSDRDGLAGKVALPVGELLVELHRLSRILRRRRFAGGALELQLPEVRIELDREGRVEAVRETVHDESHQLIEECMLAANTSVARELTRRGLIYLRRVHPSPNPTKLAQFATFVSSLGFQLDRPGSRPALQKLIDTVSDGPLSHAVNYALLRSFKRAEYTGREDGHFALAAEDYCHFTSPIRRYPDLVIHRIVAAIATGGRPKGLTDVTASRLGRSCSRTERRAEAAERSLVRLKLLHHLRDRTGETIDAVVVGVEKFGVICRGTGIPVEALVHVSELDKNDHFDFDRGELILTARRSGRSFRLGDPVRVKIVSVDLDERSIRFEMDGESGRIRQVEDSGRSRSGTGSSRSADGSRSRKSRKGGKRGGGSGRGRRGRR